MARIHIESLSPEYRKKLRERALTKETIDSLAREISKQYLLRKRSLKMVALLLIGITVLMIALTLFSPSAPRENLAVIAFSFVFVSVLEVLILVGLYYGAVCRIPRQFAAGLQKGYPELVMEYGYDQIVSGNLAAKATDRQLPFSLGIEDIFPLKNSNDVVVVGFAHGLITRGNSVYIIDRNNPARGRATALITGIEKNGQTPVAQAADCHVALRVQRGAEFGLVPGMYLYRE